MQVGKTLERGSTSRWREESFHVSGRFSVHPDALLRRQYPSAHFCRADILHHRQSIAVLFFFCAVVMPRQ